MPKVVKYFILGMSKTLDIGNNIPIYEINTKNNIRQSWENVGSTIEKRLSKGLEDEQRKCTNKNNRARIC
ncbi:hypothetical protein PJV89_05365 [Aliarcobacter butzleri]|uniref:hypothetical protein n=1 Tax=Aliarcobacter butzleri TaxID=28197 RepID=UPI00263C84C2|nr:hypothetical protein [Aliarcobacter butzleri]MDN5077628.1 hypothetical protein [Aliarcobacter butzleri]MDN5118824.1 hypothetical protein [Aliarcobacter butzleri]MDS1315792.1 hypothetical protein [Aliarcobacter butzleri]